MSDHTEIVEKAQQGNLQAFSLLVESFRPMATTLARSWLGDPDLAQDVVQEAFLDAYTEIGQLQKPAAFPGWFRRIVIKHCDRQTRRAGLTIDQGVDPNLRVAEQSLLREIISQEEFESLRVAIEALPEDIRLVVALHHLAGATGPQVADFLELPLSTVKKRLRVARDKLRKIDMNQREQVAREVTSIPDEVMFFVALREGQLDRMRTMLDHNPELANMKQNWGRELVYEGVIPFSTRATPLISAVERGDLSVVKLLIERGAEVNGTCGCETAEAPLWTACLLNREDHVHVLLEAGADPNIKSAAGNTPLHVASMRGYEAIARSLVDHGADIDATDEDSEAIWPLTAGAQKKAGWKPIDWARKNGHHRIVELLGGHQNADLMQKPSAKLTETGIKALDFFAPIEPGAVIRVPFKAGVGMLVLMGELTQGYLAKGNGAAVWTGHTQPPFDVPDLIADMQEFGFANSVDLFLESYQASDAERRDTFERGLQHIEQLAAQGKEVLAIIQSVDGFESDLERNLIRLTDATGSGSITTIVITPFRDEEQAWEKLKPPYSAQLTLDRARAMRNYYPAFDPLRTMSDIELPEKHAALLATIRQMFSTAGNFESILQEESPQAKCLRELSTFFTQPFHVTEAFRGTPGTSEARQQVLEDLEGILQKHHLLS